jgi:PAS domain S-box-containing protein
MMKAGAVYMGEVQREKELEERILTLETQVKHLRNDLRLTKEENEIATTNYFEMVSKLESMVANRTRDVERLRKILEQKAHELEIMLDSSPAIVFYKDAEQRLIRANTNFARAVGVPLNDLTGKKFTDFFPDYAPESLARDMWVMEFGEPVLNQKESIETPQGRRRILIDRVPYKNPNQGVAGLIGFALDVTDLEKAEEEKAALESQLQQALRMESIGTLAGGMAHNFNNLLMGILGNVSLMLLNVDPEHQHYKSLKVIQKLVKSGSELTKQLLGYAMQGKYEAKPINMSRVVKETAETFGNAKKEIRIFYDLAQDLFLVRADLSQIEQVVLNLYVNAAEAMPRGGELHLRTMNVTQEDMAGKPYRPKPGNYVYLSVRDTGVGMDKETKERIFEPFFTTKGLAKGTGLGLASSYGIIKAHGGYIDVNSQIGHGSVFEIYLPACSEHLGKGNDDSAGLARNHRTILFVDDEETILALGSDMLEALGYKVLLAGSGEEALKIYRNHREEIEMVVLDMIMPHMGGGETFDRMREINPGVKVLLSSGYSIDGQAKEILDRGCDGFIQKPFDLKGFSQTMEEIMARPGRTPA